MADDVQGKAAEAPESGVSEAQIAVHWREEEIYPPPPEFVQQANAADPAIRDRFTEDKFPDCFKEYADLLTWDQPWHTTLDTSTAPFYKWFVGGRLNASYNCVDRHAAANPDKTAIVFVGELESDEPVHISYAELHRQVNEFAALLRDFAGLKAGDRVTLHMPMVAELPVTMLACARLGVIHSEVFGGFSGTACGQRIADSGSRVLITMDGYYRAGKMSDHKVKADEALDVAAKEGQEVDKVLVWRRRPGQYASQTPMVDGRDFFVDEVLAEHVGKTVEPVSMPAEAPLFLMYTSGTTGRPKGCQHSTGGYLAYVAGTSKYYQDIHPDDVYWCMADIGWITGHSYIVYGPLALGTTTVIYEGVPNYPDGGRPWRIAEKLGVNIFHTSPTAIRMLRKVGPDEPEKYNYHFKSMTTVGEPIEPEVWRWYYTEVGKGAAAITDTWWQTENGGFLGSTLPGLEPMKPGSCGPGVLGVYPVIYDENGDEVPKGSGKAGNICIRNPWPGIFQTIWGDPDRFLSTYFRKYNKNPDSKDWHDWPYFTNDGAVQIGRRVLPDPGPRGRRDQRGRAPARHQGDRVGGPDRAGGRRGGRGAGDRRHPGPHRGGVCLAQAWLRGEQGDGGQGQHGDRDRDRQDRAAEERLDRVRHAEDPVRQDHAPGHRVRLQLRRRRRRHHAGQPRDRGGHPAPGAGGEGRARRGAARAHRGRSGRDQGLRR